MIKLNNVVKEYKDFKLNVSLNIESGKVTGLIGKNGSGKSTTIKSILGLIKIDKGNVEVLGKAINELTSNDKKQLGVALSDSGFSNYLTLANVASILKHMYDDFDENKFIKTCNDNGLDSNKLIQKYSTGMKAKLRVLVALSHSAKILIMDEPTAGMDVEARNEIISLIRNYLQENSDCSMLITSHIASDLENICDDIYLIDKGNIILHEDTDIVLSKYGVLKLSEEQFNQVDTRYFEKIQKEKLYYKCLTKDKKFYMENYPNVVVEKCGIDDLILMLTGGK